MSTKSSTPGCQVQELLGGGNAVVEFGVEPDAAGVCRTVTRQVGAWSKGEKKEEECPLLWDKEEKNAPLCSLPQTHSLAFSLSSFCLPPPPISLLLTLPAFSLQ